ncbi:MAG: O-methyltransferase [Candidatus Kapaibacterium sp.]
MSFKPTPVSEELFEYLLKNFSAEDDFLTQLRKDAKASGMPEITISPVQGAFMQFMLKMLGAGYVLEIGTLGGYSAIIMARAMNDSGHLITVELNPVHAEFAKEKIKEAGLDHIIEVVNKSGLDFVNSYKPDKPLDFVFVDADKPSYYTYLQQLTPYIRQGGIFAADNAFAFGFLLDAAPERNPDDVKSIISFNTKFREDERYFTHLLSVGDGLILGLKK